VGGCGGFKMKYKNKSKYKVSIKEKVKSLENMYNMVEKEFCNFANNYMFRLDIIGAAIKDVKEHLIKKGGK
jgi:hypothetical protein